MVGKRWSLLVEELLGWFASPCFHVPVLPFTDLLDSHALRPSPSTLKNTKSLYSNACPLWADKLPPYPSMPPNTEPHG